VKRLKKCHSPGIDDITGEMIQAGGEKKFIEESYAICNQMWKEGSIAEEWAESVIITYRRNETCLNAAIT